VLDWMRWRPSMPATTRIPRFEPLPLTLSGHVLNPFDMRTEDARFSPSGRHVAAVATQGKLLLFRVDTATRAVTAECLTTFVSSDLRAPHGVDWIDEETLVVANRQSGISFFRIPTVSSQQSETEIVALSTCQPHWFGAPGETRLLRSRSIITGPGSVRVVGEYLYAACNKHNTVTRHRIFGGMRCDDGALIAQEGIEIPDSVAISPDGAWLAVSDHDHHRVLMYRIGNNVPCGQLSDPSLHHPHGLAMSRDGTCLIAADAGGRGLPVFHSPSGAWDVAQTKAATTVEGVDHDVFERVQSETPEIVRALEGGTKGVDVSRDGSVMVTTCRGQLLRFFTIHAGI